MYYYCHHMPSCLYYYYSNTTITDFQYLSSCMKHWEHARSCEIKAFAITGSAPGIMYDPTLDHVWSNMGSHKIQPYVNRMSWSNMGSCMVPHGIMYDSTWYHVCPNVGSCMPQCWIMYSPTLDHVWSNMGSHKIQPYVNRMSWSNMGSCMIQHGITLDHTISLAVPNPCKITTSWWESRKDLVWFPPRSYNILYKILQDIFTRAAVLRPKLETYHPDRFINSFYNYER